MRDLPAGTVTLLFTDIEGSTRLLHDLGPGYADALAAHRRALRSAYQSRGGVEVDTAGDAFFYVFADAEAAVAAAADGQAALAGGPVQVRVGIHTGEPLLADEGYVGIDVHHAARVMSAGHGGQVLLSEATAHLVDSALVRDLGRHRLKDMTSPEHLFQLGDGDFPPLRTLDATNLPVAATALLGRDAEVAQLTALLVDGARVVTVTGPGGTGKTRLALQAASELVGRFHDGVFWVPLAAVTDPDLVLAEVGRTLGADDVAAHLRDRELLLLLDNLEQVLAAAPALGQVMSGAARCRMLATSRTPLHMSGEREFALGPLAGADAVVMFCERARAVGRAVEPDDTVADICRRLDGLPLAIELAASRTRLMSPLALHERLDRVLPLLTGGAVDAPLRQRTLRATIEWSLGLLPTDVRAVFARLAVFAGGATLEAVEAVCDASVDTVGTLVESSLVKVLDGVAGSTRLVMLETIREYADELLAADPLAADGLSRRHAEYYATLAEELQEQRHRPGRAADAVLLLDVDSANFRAAEAWAHRRGDAALSLRLLTSAGWVFLRGSQATFRSRLADGLSTGAGDPRLRGRAEAALSFVAYREGDLPLAAAAAARALAQAEAAADGRTVAMAYTYIANVDNADGRFGDARRNLERSIEVMRQIGDERGVLVCLVNLVDVALSAREYELAAELAERAADGARAYGDQDIASAAVMNAATANALLGRLERAREQAIEGLQTGWDRDDVAVISYGLRVAALLTAHDGRLTDAARLLGLVHRLLEELELGLEPTERILESELTRLLQALGEQLPAEVERGRAMTVDQGVTLATQAPDRGVDDR